MSRNKLKEERGFAYIGLYNPKSLENYGSVLRAAGCFDVSLVAAQGVRFPKNRRISNACTDPSKACLHIPTIEVEDIMDVIPFGAVPVAIEFIQSARSLVDYVHPERAFYIFGPEDGSVPKSVLSKCRDTVYIPAEFCLNLAATVNVVLYDRLQKQLRKQ